MLCPKIYHSVNGEERAFTFYLQVNGANMGQPSLTSTEPSVSIQCSDQEMFDFYFWLSQSLYQAGQLKSSSVGHASPPLAVKEVELILSGMAESMYPHWQQHQLVVAYLKSISAARVAFSDYVVSAEKQQGFLQRFHF